MNRISPKKRRENRAWKRVTQQRTRDVGGICEVCWTGFVEHGHHKKPRSRGGQNTIENCAAVCHDCHRRIHTNPAWAIDRGWTIEGSGESKFVKIFEGTEGLT